MAHKSPYYLRQAHVTRANQWIRQDYCGTLGTPLELAALLEKLDDGSQVAATRGEPVARVGSRVQLLDLQTEETFVIELCEPEDARPEQARISILSPLGARLLGLQRNRTAEVSFLRSRLRFMVVNILVADEQMQKNSDEAGPEQG
ncbi:GreA/GreB family elongation factor [Thioalkalivibrio sp. ALMg11]|uniref:GreA/GreB family elongation factor n=1 Tax=Thioalkalivibrio sp. ALMg11 TaxID=1158165 RepID=UPI00037F4314|nr:GreA/GreB family elongation factor [Thioalkalivibrio sp. ALMg11]